MIRLPGPNERKLRLYPFLKELTAADWEEFFPNSGKKWTDEESEYLEMWVGREVVIVDRVEGIIDLAYALGRTPDSVQDKIRRIRRANEREERIR